MLLMFFQAVLGEDAHLLADSMFRVFDDDGSGTMDFREYLMALNATK
jgi:Ca2+-binding EF-hand superfamily protein